LKRRKPVWFGKGGATVHREYVLPAKAMKKLHFDINNLISDVHTEDSASVTILKHPSPLPLFF
jgi:hypothetical protein